MTTDATRPEPPLFGVAAETYDGRVVVKPAGELDLNTVGALAAELALRMRGRLGTLVLDLSGLTFMDSTGIRLLLTVQAETRERGIALVVQLGDGPARRVLDVTGLTARFEQTDA